MTLGPHGATLRDGQYSFEGDWKALGALLASTLNVTVTTFGDLTPRDAGSPVAQLGPSEVALLRRLTAPRRSDDLDPASIARAMDEAAAEAARGAGSRTGSLVLCFGQNAGLGDAVFDRSVGCIASDDYKAQLDWVRADLDGGARLLTPRDFSPASDRLRLAALQPSVVVIAVRRAGPTNSSARTDLVLDSNASKLPSWTAYIAPITLPPETVDRTLAF